MNSTYRTQQMLSRLLYAVCLGFFGLVAMVGCGRPFDVATPAGFVELRAPSEEFAYQAASPEGLVMGMRVIEDEERGDLDFWARTITLRLHDSEGYTVTGSADIKSADGTAGKLLRFGHDHQGKPYTYEIAIFLAQGRLFLWEAGGDSELTTKHRKLIDAARAALKVRCNVKLAPVLASRTCNRW